MNSLALAPQPALSRRERYVSLLDALAYGLYPPLSCSACRDSLADRCGECAQKVTDLETVCAAIAEIEDAPTDAEALAVYRRVMLHLAGAESGAL